MARWDEHPRLAAWLRPLAWLYGLGWRLLRLFKPARPWRAPVPVLSVGNLSVGGTGKSPLVRALAAQALKAGRRPAILLRGYRSAPGPRPLPVSMGRGALTDAVSSGDEAQEHALQAGASVWVDPDRRNSARAAVEAGAELLILDDGFQRRHQVARDLDLLLADWGQLMAGERLLPAGPWREPWSQAAAADAILISGAPKGMALKALASALPAAWAGKPLFRLDLRPLGLQAWPTGRSLRLGSLKGKRVAALSGLGNPSRFEASLAAMGAKVLPWRFPDHHPFSPEQLAHPPAGAELIVSTRKDAQRLPAASPFVLPCAVLLVQAQVSPAAPFNALIRRVMLARRARGRHA